MASWFQACIGPCGWSNILVSRRDGIIPSLLLGKFHVIISSMIITPGRNLNVNFTAPYATDGFRLAANKKLAGVFKGIENFNRTNVKLAVRRGAVLYISLIQELFPNSTMVEFDDDDLALKEVPIHSPHVS